MTSSEIRTRFLEFFKKRGHAIIPSASLVTSDEKGITNPTLFNTAGMQPLIPYLLGKPHPEGKRLVDVQKCLRTIDIDDIGDKTHATFFEMLGNWSLGDYFKEEAINWSYELLTSKSETVGDRGFGLDPKRLYVTVFAGDAHAGRDDEAAAIWAHVFHKNQIDIGGNTVNGEHGRIFYMGAEDNWWEAGENGPCGPDTEMFYDMSNRFAGASITKNQFLEATAAREIVEVWNDVFMQYEKKDGKIIGKLPKPSVDTGAGLERLAMALAVPPVDNFYETDLLKAVMDKIKESAKTWNLTSARIIADHVRASVFLMADGVLPNNTGRGYILRRLLRRAVMNANTVHLEINLSDLVSVVIDTYRDIYTNLTEAGQKERIESNVSEEVKKFTETLSLGLQELEKHLTKDISGHIAFKLFSSYGLPIDVIHDVAKQNGIEVDTKGFDAEFKKHQHVSRTGAEHKFKGGLADASDPMVVRYHTATHLLHQALHDVLGDAVKQKGSNITTERLRFDFAHHGKMTDEQKTKVEDIINSKIEAALPMNMVTMPKAEAEKTGARHFFGEKYGEEISIYFIGNDLATAYSKEFCGGPHVKNTSELAGPEGKWRFKIQKEEAVAQGVRRIKAVLE